MNLDKKKKLRNSITVTPNTKLKHICVYVLNSHQHLGLLIRKLKKKKIPTSRVKRS